MIFDVIPLEDSSMTIPRTAINGSTIALTTIPLIPTANHNTTSNANLNPKPDPKFSSDKCQYGKCCSRKWRVTIDRNVY